MPFTYPTVSIGSHAYEVYADHEQADLYIDAAMSSAADTWRDTTLTSTDTKSRALVSATRWLDSATWIGDKTDPTQDLLWPRANIPNIDSTMLPSLLMSACIELAMLLADNPDARTDLKDLGVKQLKAGSVALDFFRPESDTQVQTIFPATVMALVSQWLGGMVSVGSVSYDTDDRSKLLHDKYDFGHGV